MSFHLIWALVVAGLVATNCATHARLESAQTTIGTYKADIKKQKQDAAFTLAAETERVRQLQAALKLMVDEQEKKDALNKLKVDDLAGQLKLAGGPSGRLRDPNADRCGNGGGRTPGEAGATAKGSTGDQAEAGGLLSVQLSQLLRERLRDADDINTAYASCRGTAMNDRAMQPD